MHRFLDEKDGRIVLLVTTLAVLAFSLSCFFSYQRMYHERQEYARNEAQHMLQGFETHSTRLFDYMDTYLRTVRAYHAEQGSSSQWEHFVDKIKPSHAELFTGILTIVDRNGWVVYQSKTPKAQLPSFGQMTDLDHFQYFLQHPGDSLFIGPSRRGRMTGNLEFRLARPILVNGVFDGLIMLSMRPEYFTDFFREASIGDRTSTTLLTQEQMLITHQPATSPEMYGRVLTNLTKNYGIQIAQGVGGSVFGIVSSFDNQSRDVFYKTLNAYPVTLFVSIAQQDIDDDMASLRRNLSLLALAFTLAALLVCALILRLLEKNRQLRRAEAFNLNVLNSIGAEIAVLDRHGEILAVNEPWRRFSLENGQAAAQATPHNDINSVDLGLCRLVTDDSAPDIQAGLLAVLDGQQASFNREYLCHTLQQARWFSMQIMPLGANSADGVVITHTDITRIKQAEEQVRIAAVAFESQEGMMVTDAKGIILRVNRAFTKITGYSAEEVLGHTPRLLQSGRHNADFYHAMWEQIRQTGCWQGEIWDKRKSGEDYPKWLTISAVTDESGAVTHYVGAHYDITEQKQSEERIRSLAYFDQLTGLPNRTLLLDRLKQSMVSSGRTQHYGALLFIDLDNFKSLNDTLGHDIGDLLLQQVAERLRLCIREGDTAARLGGDEFVILLKDLGHKMDEAAAHAEVIGEKIIEALNRSYQLNSHEHHSTPSIGVSLFGHQEETREELIKQADMAMYQAKAAGRNALRFFDPDMQASVTARVILEKELREAIPKGELILYYQAQINASGQCTGAEALVRWQHPQRGMVFPDQFIALAEETGLILPLGQWVLETACTQLAIWARQADSRHLTLAVNVSARQLRQKDFVAQVLSVLERTGADPLNLKLELTESHLLSEVEDTIGKMTALREQGVSFALDDFGTGYSSLTYLKRLPLEKLKIDRSFITDVLTNPNDAAIARTIVALAQALGLSVLAEGVETEEQRLFLASNGCYWYQGYLFSRPLPLAAFEDYFRQLAAKNASRSS